MTNQEFRLKYYTLKWGKRHGKSRKFVVMIFAKEFVGKKPPPDINVILIFNELKSLIPEILNNKNIPKLKME